MLVLIRCVVTRGFGLFVVVLGGFLVVVVVVVAVVRAVVLAVVFVEDGNGVVVGPWKESSKVFCTKIFSSSSSFVSISALAVLFLSSSELEVEEYSSEDCIDS